MKTIKDQLRQVKRDLKQASREARQRRAEVLRRVERDEWVSFKAECVRLRRDVKV